MSTQSEFRTPQTHVADLPPLAVTTEGIPASEHLEAPSPVPVVTESPAQARSRRIILALEGVLLLMIVAAFAVGVSQLLSSPSPSGLHMGLSDQAWSEYRAGERDTTPVIPTTRAWTPWIVDTPFVQR